MLNPNRKRTSAWGLSLGWVGYFDREVGLCVLLVLILLVLILQVLLVWVRRFVCLGRVGLTALGFCRLRRYALRRLDRRSRLMGRILSLAAQDSLAVGAVGLRMPGPATMPG